MKAGSRTRTGPVYPARSSYSIVERVSMNPSSQNAAVLWTGGKDCALAHYEAVLAGHQVSRLVTFAPESGVLLAHPLDFMSHQAEAMGLPHCVVTIAEPYREGYVNAIRALGAELGVDALITGDVAEVDGYPNWMRECSEGSGMAVLTPLWGVDRLSLLRRLLDCRFRVVISCAKGPWLTAEWVGREITQETLDELRSLSQINGLDPCGENGEFHTLVTDSPLFHNVLRIDSFTSETRDSMHNMRIQAVSARDK